MRRTSGASTSSHAKRAVALEEIAELARRAIVREEGRRRIPELLECMVEAVRPRRGDRRSAALREVGLACTPDVVAAVRLSTTAPCASST